MWSGKTESMFLLLGYDLPPDCTSHRAGPALAVPMQIPLLFPERTVVREEFCSFEFLSASSAVPARTANTAAVGWLPARVTIYFSPACASISRNCCCVRMSIDCATSFPSRS